MLEREPSKEELRALLGADRYRAFADAVQLVESRYDMDAMWNSGGRKWTYEYKYRRGGKTLCALYAREECFGFMVIFGAAEREKFEARRGDFSAAVQSEYDAATTFHDGKWLMLTPTDSSHLGDIEKLLEIKRKPNRK